MYFEDIFVTFYEGVMYTDFDWLHTDFSGARSFYSSISNGKNLTAKQGQYLVRILEKYKNAARAYGVDYIDSLKIAVWKEPFRELDLTKRVFVEKDKNGKLWVAFKFPFQLKEQFEKELFGGNNSPNSARWDPDRKIRFVDFYALNLIQAYEFAKEHGIEIDETFMFAMSEVEQIWQNQNSIIPYSVIDNGIKLINASESAQEWWNTNSTGNMTNDILLAKQMGFTLNLSKPPSSPIEKIGNTKSNSFWTSNYGDFFEIYKNIDGKVAVLVDRTESSIQWLKGLVNQAKYHEVNVEDFRVCFRASNKENPEINQWIKDNGLGGKVEDGRILVFQHQPPKWLFSSKENVKIIITNLLHPPTNSKTQDWIKTHHCVIYLGDIKASVLRNQHIVNL